MSRYINEDALEDKAKQYSLGYYEEDEWAVPFYEIADAPSIDIVRCKECRWYKDFDGCFFSTAEVDEDDFCSFGEREGK